MVLENCWEKYTPISLIDLMHGFWPTLLPYIALNKASKERPRCLQLPPEPSESALQNPSHATLRIFSQKSRSSIGSSTVCSKVFQCAFKKWKYPKSLVEVVDAMLMYYMAIYGHSKNYIKPLPTHRRAIRRRHLPHHPLTLPPQEAVRPISTIDPRSPHKNVFSWCRALQTAM